MKIEDHTNHSSWVPATSILEEFIPRLDKRYLIGIKKIILLDSDYHKDKKRKAAGRYVPVKRTKLANIEFYLGHYNDLPEEAKRSRMFIAWNILLTLAHELYIIVLGDNVSGESLNLHKSKKMPMLGHLKL